MNNPNKTRSTKDANHHYSRNLHTTKKVLIIRIIELVFISMKSKNAKKIVFVIINNVQKEAVSEMRVLRHVE